MREQGEGRASFTLQMATSFGTGNGGNMTVSSNLVGPSLKSQMKRLPSSSRLD